MYVVLVDHKSKEAMTDLMLELRSKFPLERFTIEGSEEKGYQFRIEGLGDELAPRKIAQDFLKKWKPKPIEDVIRVDVIKIIMPPNK